MSTINFQTIIQKLQSAPYGLLRTSTITPHEAVNLHMETWHYQSIVQMLYEMLQHGLSPKYAFMSKQVNTLLHIEQAAWHPELAESEIENRDAIGFNDALAGKQTTHFVVVPDLDEHTIIFGFFEAVLYTEN
jgi:hypothetical protein